MMGHYSSHTDTNDGAPSLVSVGGIVSHHWCQWEEYGRNSTPSLEYHTEIPYHIEIKSD
ncbi:unnamed protein product, partial [Staurois parvus]